MFQSQTGSLALSDHYARIVAKHSIAVSIPDGKPRPFRPGTYPNTAALWKMFQSQTGSLALSDRLARLMHDAVEVAFQSQTGSLALSDKERAARLAAEYNRFNPRREASPFQT